MINFVGILRMFAWSFIYRAFLFGQKCVILNWVFFGGSHFDFLITPSIFKFFKFWKMLKKAYKMGYLMVLLIKTETK